MSRCYECAHYSNFYHDCSCPAKNAAYDRPLDVRTCTSGEAPACAFFVDIDEVI